MNKLLQTAATGEDHDDVAGLFQRLGGHAQSRGYQDFSHDEVRAAAPLSAPLTDAAVVPPPVPADASATAGAEPEASSAPAPGPEAPAPRPLAAVREPTPLELMFLRLAKAPVTSQGHSPLSRLRES